MTLPELRLAGWHAAKDSWVPDQLRQLHATADLGPDQKRNGPRCSRVFRPRC